MRNEFRKFSGLGLDRIPHMAYGIFETGIQRLKNLENVSKSNFPEWLTNDLLRIIFEKIGKIDCIFLHIMLDHSLKKKNI
jgi:hypothetical protein